MKKNLSLQIFWVWLLGLTSANCSFATTEKHLEDRYPDIPDYFIRSQSEALREASRSGKTLGLLLICGAKTCQNGKKTYSAIADLEHSLKSRFQFTLMSFKQSKNSPELFEALSASDVETFKKTAKTAPMILLFEHDGGLFKLVSNSEGGVDKAGAFLEEL